MDDHEDVLTLLQITAEIDGRFEVVGTAAEGSAAIEMAGRLNPDVVILDHMVDHSSKQRSGGDAITGPDAATKIRSLLPDGFIVMYTGLKPTPGLANAADMYLVKGEIDPSTMLERVADAVRPQPDPA
jgi:DNA-binding NarL/FixJ family response regulator